MAFGGGGGGVLVAGGSFGAGLGRRVGASRGGSLVACVLVDSWCRWDRVRRLRCVVAGQGVTYHR